MHSVQPRRSGDRAWAPPGRRVLVISALAIVAVVGTALAALWLLGDNPAPTTAGTEADAVFADVQPGHCLSWPQTSPDQLSIVDCAGDHRFEVAASLDAGAQRSQNVALLGGPATQVDHQQCQAAVGRYLGPRYDPDGRFTVGVLWSAADGSSQTGRQRTLCGLQLPGAASQQLAFKGRVADLDQSKVWPAGTCLGIDPRTNQSTDVPVDCSARHAVEVTGTVTLAGVFTGVPPADADQDAFITTACAPMTDAYLSPVALRATGLALAHATIAPASWTAGTRQVACRIGARDETGGWATLVGSAKGPLQIGGQSPAPAPETPSAPTPSAPPPSASASRAQTSAPGHGQPPATAPPHGANAAPDVDNPDQPMGPLPGPVAQPSEAPAQPPPQPPPPAEPPPAPPPPPPAEPPPPAPAEPGP